MFKFRCFRRTRRCPKCGGKESSRDNGLCITCLRAIAHEQAHGLKVEIEALQVAWSDKQQVK